MAYHLYAPAIVAGAVKVGQGVQGGFESRLQADQEVSDTKGELASLGTQYARNSKDSEATTQAAISRRRALIAAGGAAGTASASALLDATAATGGQNAARLQQDYNTARNSLRARVYNLRRAKDNIGLGLITGSAVIGGSYLPTKSTTPSNTSYGAAPGSRPVGSNGMAGGGV